MRNNPTQHSDTPDYREQLEKILQKYRHSTRTVSDTDKDRITALVLQICQNGFLDIADSQLCMRLGISVPCDHSDVVSMHHALGLLLTKTFSGKQLSAADRQSATALVQQIRQHGTLSQEEIIWCQNHRISWR